MVETGWNLPDTSLLLAKDFIETAEGLIFAVVEQGEEQGRAQCFLRYVWQHSAWRKFPTQQANNFLSDNFPQYLYYSAQKDAHLHGVPLDRIVQHYRPRTRLRYLQDNQPRDQVEQDLLQLCHLFQRDGLDLNFMGVTGSVLINAHKHSSDIDLVIYSRQEFFLARKITQLLLQQKRLGQLTETDWQDAYERRSCELSFEDYRWHEQRKFNKAIINGRKFDLNLIDLTGAAEDLAFKKQGAVKLQARIVDDSFGFDYPARFVIDHPQAQQIISFTATYTGQAIAGEWVEVSGQLEHSDHGGTRIVVGSTREAESEYIKVIQKHA